ncbi:MAG: RHS repeat protein, partial [Acidobacteria bacterium]|nr:RHS repeat protein [Acidobacteriota bacterium]
YDILGRVSRSSVPTEVSVPDPNNPDTWTPAGDDQSRGFLWTYQYYDWKGRVNRTVPTDSNGTDGKDTLITYEGCGCAGGQITTIKGPITEAIDVAGNLQTTKRRTQKAYEDILGRNFKTEAWDLDGASIYSTVRTKFNGRDQSVLTTEYQGAEGSGTFQETTATFDGHGRLASSHKPEQRDTANNLKYTTYSYNADDRIQSMTDGRGAVTNYTYNATTGLLSQMSWSVPQGSNIALPPSVLFTYDNVGNRLTMVDGLGTVNYEYNQLSQMTAETRSFNDTLADKPVGNYRIGYTYTLGGQLRSYTDPFNKEIAYSHDRAGRLNSISGTSFGGVTNYASSPVYRAWGALKSVDYGSGYRLNQTFDTGLRPLTLNVDNPNDSSPGIFDKDYEYYPDGSLKLADENRANLDTYDRSFTYDHQARVKDAKSGIEAKGQTQTNLLHLPYRQSYAFSAVSGLSSRESTLWNYNDGDWDYVYTFTNNLVTNQGYLYDADGQQTFGEETTFTYDAAGQIIRSARDARNEAEYTHDGSGQEGKRSQRAWDSQTGWGNWVTRYFVFSNVLGRNVTELGPTGKKKRTYVLVAGSIVARQAVDDSNQESVGWEHRDPSGMSARTSWVNNSIGNSEAAITEETDAMGNNVGTHGAFSPPDRGLNPPSPSDRSILYSMDTGDCTMDGIWVPCSMAERTLRSGAGVECPENNCGPRRATYTDPLGRQHDFLTTGFQAYADGTSGFGIPVAILRFREGHNWAAGVRAQSGIASLSGGGGSGQAGEPCPFTLEDGTVVQGTRDEKGVCVFSIPDTDGGTTYADALSPSYIDWSSYQRSTPYGPIVDFGRVRTSYRDQLSNSNQIAGWCSVAASVGEYANVRNKRWYGNNSRYGTVKGNRIGWGGNGPTGARFFSLEKAKTFSAFSKTMAGVGQLIIIHQYREGQISLPKFIVDTGFNAAGTFGGGYGAGASVAYFGVDATIGWDKVAEAEDPRSCRNFMLLPHK